VVIPPGALAAALICLIAAACCSLGKSFA